MRRRDLGREVSLILHVLGIRFERVGSDLLVILLQSSQVLTSLAELAFLHTLTNIPVDEGTLAVHEVELVVQTRPGLGDGGGVGQHRDGSVDRGQTTVGGGRSWDGNGLLIVDADLETSRAPLDQVERGLGLEGCNSSVAVAGNDVSTVQQSDGHVLSVAGVADHHLVVGLEACGLVSNRHICFCSRESHTLEGKVGDLEALVGASIGRDDGSVADQGVVNTRVGHQVGLEFVQIDVEGTIETEGRRNGADDLGDQAVEVLVAGAGNVEVATADIVDSLVIDKEGTVRVLDRAMGRQHSVVGLNNGGGDTRSRVDGELQLALLAVISRQALQEQSTKTRTSTTTKRVEDQEALKAAAVVCNLPC